MKHGTDSPDTSERFLTFASGFILFAWSAYALAAAGIFSHGSVAVMAVLAIAGIAVTLFRFLSSESRVGKTIFALVILYAVFLLSGTTPTIFSGRDHGSIAEAAIELSRNGTLSFSTPSSDTFFAIYGPGKALNFPGFYYSADGKLLSQFPVSYSAWLAAFHSLFGLHGIVAGNGILLTLSLLTLFVLVRELSDEQAAIGATIIATASFLPSWFAKFTLTENLALFLYLFLALSIINFLRKPSRFTFLAAVFSATLLSVTRIEGPVFLAITFGILFVSNSGRHFFTASSPLLRTAPIICSIALVFLDIIINTSRYISVAKALFQGSTTPLPNDVLDFTGSLSVPVELWNLFLPYGILVLFLFGIIGIVILLIRKDWVRLLPVLLALPTFLYLVNPNISADHPWMLRRFLFSVWPALLITAVTGSSALLRSRANAIAANRTILMVSIVIALTCLPPTWSAFRFSENSRLVNATDLLAEYVGNGDLVLIDRNATGDPYAIPAGPLRFLNGRNAAYFFNQDDFARIPKGDYDHIYLLVQTKDIGRYSALNLSDPPIAGFRFERDRIGPLPLGDPRFPDKESKSTDAVLITLDTL
ncbi:MAG TPA: hypothetical protein VN420_05395 [Candidatus Fimivivens sp.]|nr:hypothetical protein [Candidatus Fimivivens sp.]